MGGAKGAQSKGPRPPLRDQLGRFTSRSKKEPPTDLEDALGRFDKTGIIQVQFGDLGVYTIENWKTGSRFQHTPVTLWWKAGTDTDVSRILHNSALTYELPYTKEKGQALILNIADTNYGKGGSARLCAEAYLNALLMGVALHRTSCGVTDSGVAARLNVNARVGKKVEITII